MPDTPKPPGPPPVLDPAAAQRLTAHFKAITAAYAAAWSRIAEALRPLAELAEHNRAAAAGELLSCHCLCPVSHPDHPEVCLGEVTEHDVVRLRFETPAVGLTDVPMCAPCAGATTTAIGDGDPPPPGPRHWRINPETLNVEPADGKPPGTFTAQQWAEQHFPDCPVCGAPLDVTRLDMSMCTDPEPRYGCGAWDCPNGCDIRAALQTDRNEDD